ncbi:MAG: hypothetical protein LBF82_01395 [Lactobacillales bacterium]|nr:hypothetical protein [Lactobacillales bacterium]
MKLVRLLLKIRLIQQTSLLKRFLSNYNQKISMKVYILLSFTLEVFTSLVISFGGYYFFLQRLSLNIRFYLFFIIILGIFTGFFSYRQTHVFPFEEFRELSPKNVKSLSKILLLTSLIEHLLFSSSFFGVLTLLSLMSLKTNGNRLIFFPVILFIYLSFYYLSNRLMGAYIYHKQIQKIGLLRLVVYLLSGIFWFFVGKAIIVFIYGHIYFSLSKHIKSIKDFSNKKISHQIAKEIFDFYFNGIKQFIHKLEVTLNQINGQHLLMGILVLIFLVFLVSILPIRFLSTHKKVVITNKYDFFNVYTFIVYHLAKKHTHPVLLKNNLLNFKDKRWLFANNFLEYFLITYESCVYLGVGSTIIFYIKNDPISQAQVLLWTNLFMMGNQSAQVRGDLYPYFSFGIERKQLPLIRSAPNGWPKVFAEKLWIFRSMFTSSMIVWIGIDVLFFWLTDLTLIYLISILLIVVLGFYIYPFIQMYMVPLATKFDFNNETEIGQSKDEETIIGKLQEIPRKILTKVITLVSVIFLFIDHSWKRILFPIEVIYLFIATFFILYTCQKILIKGLVKVNELK